MTQRSSVTPARWTALGLLCLIVVASACSHSEPFTNPEIGEEPFDPGPPARLTVNTAHDGSPSWLADGTGILYSARQPDREDIDVCLAELPPTGGQQRRLVCDIPGDRESTDAAQSSAASADGRVALLSAGNGNIGGNSPVFLDLALLPTLDALDPQRVRALPFTPTGGTPQDYAGHLRWLTADALVYVGQHFLTKQDCPACVLDTVIVGTEVTTLTVDGTTATAVPGTEVATGVAPILDGSAILYTLPNDTRIYRRALGSGDVTVVHDFGAEGIARDVHAAGNRVAAVVGGRVAFSVDPRLGPVQWDSGGVLHVFDLEETGSQSLDTPGRLYRRPALSPDGSRIVAEGFPLIIVHVPGEGPDTTVSKSGDIYLFGGE
jgi:WD40-like Beta Propeller Repeat